MLLKFTDNLNKNFLNILSYLRKMLGAQFSLLFLVVASICVPLALYFTIFDFQIGFVNQEYYLKIVLYSVIGFLCLITSILFLINCLMLRELITKIQVFNPVFIMNFRLLLIPIYGLWIFRKNLLVFASENLFTKLHFELIVLADKVRKQISYPFVLGITFWAIFLILLGIGLTFHFQGAVLTNLHKLLLKLSVIICSLIFFAVLVLTIFRAKCNSIHYKIFLSENYNVKASSKTIWNPYKVEKWYEYIINL
ncbi:Uncharacterised protein [Mycoplasmopsis gallopavonis]|uniref:Uncharacterized protein n=1 Tax=Mycoplasmopsis gallopavonis TaxID=76629 RepID=A0A449AZ38_9BACT|nr:hypothetical protein [Mycoplasmopsis gallopavonis]VEU72761.1 Uncharacterised protein [Mycoplasmopsis gallopavonis]